MTTARSGHRATLLQNGKVLIVGGTSGASTILASAELYDPVTGTFTSTVSMTAARSSHTATLLPNGKVLIAGGQYYAGTYWQSLDSAELYDPSTGTFTPTGTMTVEQSNHTATLLQNGKVLIVGGHLPTDGAELYDPVAGTFATTGHPTLAEPQHTATLLSNGMVLITGGLEWISQAFPNDKRAELYDPSTGTFAATGSMTTMRGGPAATLLSDGKVLVAGGRYDTSAEIYDPSTGTFTATGNMTEVRARPAPTATLLGNGKVLVVGDEHETGSAELYQ
jgi:WD40 repeat protein